jgi:hypothetical protein
MGLQQQQHVCMCLPGNRGSGQYMSERISQTWRERRLECSENTQTRIHRCTGTQRQSRQAEAYGTSRETTLVQSLTARQQTEAEAEKKEAFNNSHSRQSLISGLIFHQISYFFFKASSSSLLLLLSCYAMVQLHRVQEIVFLLSHPD